MYYALVETRRKAHAGDAETCANLADLVHNLPSAFYDRTRPSSLAALAFEFECLADDPGGQAMLNYAKSSRNLE